MNSQNRSGSAFLEKLEQVNDGRSFLANLFGFVCVGCTLGLANLICRFGLHIELTYILRILIVAVAAYFFLPLFILWLWKGR
ncbi:hypothetical protein [Acetobacter senegalensis]|uniref:hypothetical protein n=1 Tax=Acetobacter senegalensis TaxID=446692 RepID=UPI00128B748A|nr:hypothetical protein [Acetobacter senegalensis]MCG4256468.1 hypothetical protein [Acetobacter senegalensis]MCG4266374.1 hypothetical protein [Acetobacter senegalensis]MPQ73943.1 hypothetical protein [Acetobacter senegalensis]